MIHVVYKLQIFQLCKNNRTSQYIKYTHMINFCLYEFFFIIYYINLIFFKKYLSHNLLYIK
jgi:hypothetical protein